MALSTLNGYCALVIKMRLRAWIPMKISQNDAVDTEWLLCSSDKDAASCLNSNENQPEWTYLNFFPHCVAWKCGAAVSYRPCHRP
ncbi:hypothetical protein AVEN_140081-1 [Araneus ventricosus]|uniref:Uncharacterized protein n=1 Tax=Araneus ventricosus TaxID=182803 RepID=A0A4Y2GJX5_ARAVE|nr:hypothetical protein AVEN_140081-1 [Araneus ventricosus]